MDEFDTLYCSLKQWIPTVTREFANCFIAKNVDVLSEEGRGTFFSIIDLYCKDFGKNNDWFVFTEAFDDGDVYRCDARDLPDKLAFILFKFVQKSVEMTTDL